MNPLFVANHKIESLPSALGYQMPPEWAPHAATWLAWPHNAETWPGKRLREVERAYLQMIEALLPHETVHLLVQDGREEEAVRKRTRQAGINGRNLETHPAPTVDAWIRDYGPTFVKNEKGEKAWVKWIFNAWGSKSETHTEDHQVFIRHRELVRAPSFEAGFILEGGSIEVNGEGTCLTTEQCLLHPNRNRFSKDVIEQKLRDYLGASHTVWLKEGIRGDDTDGHVDDLARFVNENTIAAAFEDDPSDENDPILKRNWEILQESSDPNGRRWNLVKLPMPGKVFGSPAAIRLPATYANFYIANEVVLLPVYRHPNDERAVKILRELFPKRRVTAIEATGLVYGLGSLHCVTQQEPA